MTEKIAIRSYRPENLAALAALINEADAIDRQERAKTLAELEHELSFPTQKPETDCFLAVEGERLVGYARLYIRPGDGRADGTIYCWGVVHPS
jgi:hypothetical protein